MNRKEELIHACENAINRPYPFGVKKPKRKFKRENLRIGNEIPYTRWLLSAFGIKIK